MGSEHRLEESQDEYEFDFETPAQQPGFTFLDLDDETRRGSERLPPLEAHWDPSVEGTRFGSYVVTGTLGSGAAGLVLSARHAKTKLRVAIKLLHHRMDQKGKARERFRREAEAASQVRHPNVIRVHATGIARGRPFMVLEHLAGGSLADVLEGLLKQGRSVPVDRAVELTDMMLAGLEAVHAAGLLHRDVKPDNMLLDVAGHLKLADFGLVKLAEGAAHSITMTGASIGTPLYMSPEQCTNAKAVDARSDLYSVGATLFELLTGLPPFPKGRSPVALHMLQSAGPAPRVRDTRPATPRPVEAWVTRMLAYDARQRFPSARKARRALAAALPLPQQVKLKILQGGKEIHRGLMSRGDSLVLGRASEADLSLDGRGLSRFHCRVEMTDKGLVAVDLDSTNGTWLGPNRIAQPSRLSRKGVVRLGKHVRLEVRWQNAR
jgi:serine/threonine protein kinase